MKDIKFKPLNKEQLRISADRLTRFKEPETKYLRVYKDIITGNLINPSFKKSDLDKMSYETLTYLAEYIINNSLLKLGIDSENNLLANQRLIDYENSLFTIDSETQKLIKNKINYNGIIELLEDEIPQNLKWLELLTSSTNPNQESWDKGFRFPIDKVIICEGITEETLLPEFAKLLNYDFDKNGIHIISAGGKNQVVKTFYKYSQTLKIPIFVLLDSDAKENYNEILPRLRNFDKIHILDKGEFEDILPLCLVEKTLKYAIENISLTDNEKIDNSNGMVHYLEDFFKNRGTHEFKKSEFANLVKINISGQEDISDEFRQIIEELKNLPKIDMH